MSAQLDFPPLVTEQPSTAIATQAGVPAVTLKDAALVHFSALDAPLRALAERYRDVAFDVSNTKGLDAAKKARQDLRENGRFAVQRAEAAFKTAANDAKKAVEAKAEQLVAIVRPVEDSVDAQIKVREAAIEQERQERAIAEAARQQKHRDAIAVIAGYVGKAEGLPSARIQAGLEYVRKIEVGAEVFEDFADRAAEQKAVTIERLEAMLARTLAAEEAARKAEAQRIENERVAAELAEQRRVLAEQAAELERQQAAVAAAAIDAALAEAAPIIVSHIPRPQEQCADADQSGESSVRRIEAERRMADAFDAANVRDCHSAAMKLYWAFRGDESFVPLEKVDDYIAALNALQPEGTGIDLASGPDQHVEAVVDTRPQIKLGDVCARLGFTMTAAFVTETLRITPAGTDKRAVLFAQADFHRIIDALIAHLNAKKASY